MKNIIVSALDEQFKKDCKVINLKYEYPGYTGIEQWAIITDLSEEELEEKYEKIVTSLKPYILLSAAFGNVRNDYERNETKHRMRSLRNSHIFNFVDGDTELYHPELATDDTEALYLQEEEYAQIRSAIALLDEKQKSRVIRYFFEGKSIYKIAEEDSTSHQAISKSLANSLEKIKKFLK